MQKWEGFRVIGVAAALFAAGCDGAAADADLGDVTMEDGSRLTFFELPDGTRGVDAAGRPGSAALQLFEKNDGSVAALREAATHRPRPTPMSIRTSAGVGVIRQALSASDFQALHCPNDHDFQYCMLDRTGTWEVTREASHVHACLDAVAGTVHRKLEYDSGAFADWKTSRSEDVLEGTTICTRLEVGNNATYRFTVDQAAGDSWHASFFGNL
jgi:hypothetical protein